MTQAQSAKDRCLADLEARILKRDLAPGTALEEGPLCTAYALSRTPLREVFQRLAGAGYITLIPGKGAEVARIDLSRLRQFFRTAPLLHALVARLAAEAAGARDDTSLANAEAALRRARVARAAAGSALADHGYLTALARLGDNPYVETAYAQLLIDQTRLAQDFWRIETEADTRRIDAAIAGRAKLTKAVTEGRATEAVAHALQHWEAMRAVIERYVQPPPLTDESGSFDDDWRGT